VIRQAKRPWFVFDA